jgi:Na+/phosphate symporter
MDKRSSEAKKLLDELDAELAHASLHRRMALSWSAAERETLRMIADTVDRRVRLAELFTQCDPDDIKNRVRLSTEIRQCDNLVSRLLAKVKTDLPEPESRRSQKARAAVNVRWDKERAAG